MQNKVHAVIGHFARNGVAELTLLELTTSLVIGAISLKILLSASETLETEITSLNAIAEKLDQLIEVCLKIG